MCFPFFFSPFLRRDATSLSLFVHGRKLRDQLVLLRLSLVLRTYANNYYLLLSTPVAGYTMAAQDKLCTSWADRIGGSVLPLSASALANSVPGAPNPYSAAMCEGDYRGHALVAFGAGRRLVVARRDAQLSIVHVSQELPGEITAVACSNELLSLSADAAHQTATYSAPSDAARDALGCTSLTVIAAGTRRSIAIYVPSAMSTSEVTNKMAHLFPYVWEVAATIPWPDGAGALEWRPCSLQVKVSRESARARAREREIK
jgi:hypothetical protein